MNRLFGEYVEPFVSQVDRDVEEAIAVSKRVVEIEAIYTAKYVYSTSSSIEIVLFLFLFDAIYSG